jgi:hypothetical protein
MTRVGRRFHGMLLPVAKRIQSLTLRMTRLVLRFQVTAGCLGKAPTLTLSSRPERTWISCHVAPKMATNAPFLKERRTHLINATELHRKSGGAQWRNLQFSYLPGFTLRFSCRVNETTRQAHRARGRRQLFLSSIACANPQPRRSDLVGRPQRLACLRVPLECLRLRAVQSECA